MVFSSLMLMSVEEKSEFFVVVQLPLKKKVLFPEKYFLSLFLFSEKLKFNKYDVADRSCRRLHSYFATSIIGSHF